MHRCFIAATAVPPIPLKLNSAQQALDITLANNVGDRNPVQTSTDIANNAKQITSTARN
jgi:hypothetical protein